MTTVAQLSGHLWIMTYEFGAPVDPANPDQANYTYHVHYRIATGPGVVPLLQGHPASRPGRQRPKFVSRRVVVGLRGQERNDRRHGQRQSGLLHQPRPRQPRQVDSALVADAPRVQPIHHSDGRPRVPRDPGLVFVITGAQYGKLRRGRGGHHLAGRRRPSSYSGASPLQGAPSGPSGLHRARGRVRASRIVPVGEHGRRILNGTRSSAPSSAPLAPSDEQRLVEDR